MMKEIAEAKGENVKGKHQITPKKKEVRKAKFSELMSFIDTTKSKVIFSLGVFAALMNGCVLPVLAYVFSASFANMASLSSSRIIQTVSIYIGIGFFACVASCLQTISFEYVSQAVSVNFRLKWFSALLRQDIAFFEVHGMSGLATSIEPNSQSVSRFFGRKFGEGIQFTVTTIGGIGLALYMSWRVALIVISVVPFVSASAFIVMRINQRQSDTQNKAYTKAGTVVYQTVSSIRTVYALNAAPKMIQIYSDATQYAYNITMRHLVKVGLSNGVLIGTFIALQCLLTLYGASLLFTEVRRNGCDPSSSVVGSIDCSTTGVNIFGALLGITFAAQGVSQVATFIEALSAARVACHPAMQALKRTAGSELGQEREIIVYKTNNFDEESTDDETGDEEVGVTTLNTAILPAYAIDSSSSSGSMSSILDGAIHFKDVVFAYPTRPKNPVYNQFSLEIPANATVALVGPSGGGKSTAISLLMRFYDPLSGQVCIDGDDIRTMNVNHLRDQIGLVNQEPTLFATTIAGNIAYGCPGVTQDQIEAAARLSNAHDFISSFPDGYNTQVGDKGTQLSGGQKQRIAIARVLVKNPKILLLDEATSALDSESELVVQEALEKLLEGGKRTTVVVAHRLTTIRKADKIAYVANGRVLEYGTHEDLMTSKKGYYRSLVQEQYGSQTQIPLKLISLDSNQSLDFSEGALLNENSIKVGESPEIDLTIDFRKIKFAYPTRPSKLILNDFSLAIKRGETVALVGPSGGGKSTIASLLLRFYDPLSGYIEVDGIDMRSLNVGSLRERIGYVGQEPVLFDETIVNNIAYGCENACREDIEKAAKMANAHDFIMSFPNGYNTLVGERGTQLSGGQKQRIAIARALVKNPKILVLDEATSALDTHSEVVVQSALDQLIVNHERTTIVIAHRLSTVKNADRIAYISGGRVVELGSHEELMGLKSGRYRRLVETQTRDSNLDLLTLREIMSGNKDDKVSTDDPSDVDAFEGVETAHEQTSYTQEARRMALDDWKSIVLGAIGSIFAGGVFPAWGVMMALLINLLFTRVDPCKDSYNIGGTSTCHQYWGNVADRMKIRSYELAGYWTVIVACCLVGYTLVFVGFGTASERLNKRIRDLAFTALCKQELAYFDKRSVGVITSQLQYDAAKIHAFSGQPIRILLINFSSLIAGIVISFVSMWPFAILAFVLIPIRAFVATLEVRTYLGVDHGGKGVVDAKDTPSGMAIETLLNIRTVSSLNLQKIRYDDYARVVCLNESRSLWACVKVGSLSGISILVQQCVTALEFWWGGWLLIHYPHRYSFQNFLVAAFSLLFALFAFGTSSIGTVDKKEMQAAAQRIFQLLNRHSNINALSDEGIRLN